MTVRTKQSVVSFSSAFVLPGFDEPQPAGAYQVDYDEQLMEGLSWLGWQRVGAFIHLPAIGQVSPVHQMVPVEPPDLDAAIEMDRATGQHDPLGSAT